MAMNFNREMDTDAINVTVVSLIERELDSCDLISLVFILFDRQHSAFDNVLIFQRSGENTNLLRDWAQVQSQERPNTWRDEFLEALATCQLYRFIRRLGFNVANVKKLYPYDKEDVTHIDPMKKCLYKLCENITSDDLVTLKKTLATFEIFTSEYKSCELVLLKLMCEKCITVNHRNAYLNGCEYKIEFLARIIHNFPGLAKFAVELRNLESKYCKPLKKNMSASELSEAVADEPLSENDDVFTAEDFREDLEPFQNLDLKFIDDVTSDNIPLEDKHKIAPATMMLRDDIYPIKNPNRVGVCYILNQESFYPSKESIKNNCKTLQFRAGSSLDKKRLTETMQSLKYVTMSSDNLDHVQIFDHIKYVIEKYVHDNDSIFVLAVLSHGVLGHIYASDSVKIKIEHIKNLIGEELLRRNIDVPKMLIIQACQVEDNDVRIEADGPGSQARKGDFLTCFATAPELEAFRYFKTVVEANAKGSVFIQTLCKYIEMYAYTKNVNNILMLVNKEVSKIFIDLNHDQVSEFVNSLRKDLYLQIPNQPS